MAEKKYKAAANPEYAKAMADIRKSNAAGPHLDKRTKRKRTRGAAEKAAVREAAE